MKKIASPLFQDLSEAELDTLAAAGHLRTRQFAKHEVIFHAGSCVREIGIVLRGSVHIENLDLWGTKSILSSVGAGQAFAETYARELFQRKCYGARRVRQELSCKGVGRDIIDQVLEQYQDMDQAAGENIALVLERRYPTWREDEKARRRAVAALQRLGYSFEQVRAVMGGLDTE